MKILQTYTETLMKATIKTIADLTKTDENIVEQKVIDNFADIEGARFVEINVTRKSRGLEEFTKVDGAWELPSIREIERQRDI